MRRSCGRPGSLARHIYFAAAGSVLAAWLGCSEQVGPEAGLCGRLVRFHLGLHHAVEVVDSETTPGKPRVRIAFRGAGQEKSSVDGIALCSFSDQTGQLQVVSAIVDDERLGEGAIRTFNRLLSDDKRAADE